MMMVPFSIASLMGKRFLPGTWYVVDGQYGVCKVGKGEDETHPAILLSLLPGLTTLTNTDNNVEAVVAGVQALAVTLGAVTDEGEGVVLEVLLELGKGPVCEKKEGKREGRRRKRSVSQLGRRRRRRGMRNEGEIGGKGLQARM